MQTYLHTWGVVFFQHFGFLEFCRSLDRWHSEGTALQYGHSIKYWVISWGIKTVIEYGCARSSRSENQFFGLTFMYTRFKPLHAFDENKNLILYLWIKSLKTLYLEIKEYKVYKYGTTYICERELDSQISWCRSFVRGFPCIFEVFLLFMSWGTLEKLL